eukprot:scaffold746_cov123-Cylindrotheca_fusiformis.AAC.9
MSHDNNNTLLSDDRWVYTHVVGFVEDGFILDDRKLQLGVEKNAADFRTASGRELDNQDGRPTDFLQLTFLYKP